MNEPLYDDNKRNDEYYNKVVDTAKYILSKTEHRPKIAVICGSGLGGLAELVENRECFNYSDIPNFQSSTAPGHKGRLVFGNIGGKCCVCMQGRLHMYEGYSSKTVVFPIRVMKHLGVETIIVTNAAGGLNGKYKIGDLMIMKDHIFLPGLAGNNPLVGPNDDRFGVRFPSMSDTYNPELRKLAKSVAVELGYDAFIHEGVYAMQAGPSYESVSECRLIKILGGDVVGMSTVPETITAQHLNMRILALSLVTNECVTEFDSLVKANCEEVLQTGQDQAAVCQKYIETIISKLDD